MTIPVGEKGPGGRMVIVGRSLKLFEERKERKNLYR
jgi:hypothetical protein